MKPRISQKIKIYEKALLSIESESSVGLCSALLNAQEQLKLINKMGNARFGISFHEIKTNFPEIFKHKPEGRGIGEFWWAVSHMGGRTMSLCPDAEGKQIRIDVLKGEIAKLIEEQILNKKASKLL